MKLDEKRKVIEVLLLAGQDPDGVGYSSRITTYETARRVGQDCAAVQNYADLHWRQAYTFVGSHGDICLEAAYRLIESSPTLRREWFGGR